MISPTSARHLWGHSTRMAVLLGAALLTTPTWALAQTPAQPQCHVLGIDVHKADGGRDVRIHTDGDPTFTVFRLNDPMRVVLDVAGGDVSAVRGPLDVEDGIIGHVAVRQYQAESASIGRIIISFEGDTGYDVRQDGHDIVLHAHLAQNLSRPPASPVVAAAPKPPVQADQAQSISLPSPIPTAPVAPSFVAADTATESLSQGPNSVPQPAAKTATPPQHPGAQQAPFAVAQPKVMAHVLQSIEHHDAGVFLRMNPIPKYTTQTLQSPPRFVVDLPATRKKSGRVQGPHKTAWAHKVRLGKQTDGLRVVFDLKSEHTAYLTATAHGLWVRPTLKTELNPGMRAAAPNPQNKDASQLNAVRCDSALVNQKVQTRIFLSTQGDVQPHVDVSNDRAWVLEMAGTTLHPDAEAAIDTSSLPGAVALVSVFAAQRTPPKAHVVVNLNAAATQTLTRVPKGWMWTIESRAPAITASVAMPKVAAFVADAPINVSNDFPTIAPTPRNRAISKRISIDVKDADIINVLRLISEETGENIIASDEVKGKVSLKLRQVPADQALDTMLRTKGFDRVRQNNILRVASAESIQKEREQDLARRKAMAEVEDTFIKMVTINYATAGEVVDQLKPMLTPRGSVQVDARTNTLIMQDVAANIDRLVELARRLDKQTPLVNIQARIVEAQSSYLRDLGVQWGGTTQNTSRTGNPTGVYFPGDVTVNGAADAGIVNQTGGVTAPSRYAVNLPAALNGAGGGLGFILGSAGGSHLLDLRLTAMETNGSGKIISSPEVSTLDNKTARVSQGVEIPVSVVSAAGTNVRFVPAVLELEVTPHVTNDGTVLLKIKVQKSQPDFSRSTAGNPSIQKKQAETEVLVRDGDTSVIGGIYTRDTSDSYSEVPFLARIPLLGSLFREHLGQDNRSELLVFITPRIINRDESVVQTGSILTGNKAQQP